VEPVLTNPGPAYRYKSGTWGPHEAEAFIPNAQWHDPVKTESVSVVTGS